MWAKFCAENYETSSAEINQKITGLIVMNRRNFIQLGITGASILSGEHVMASTSTSEIIEATIADLQAGMSEGRLTSKELTSKYLARMLNDEDSAVRELAHSRLTPGNRGQGRQTFSLVG